MKIWRFLSWIRSAWLCAPRLNTTNKNQKRFCAPKITNQPISTAFNAHSNHSISALCAWSLLVRKICFLHDLSISLNTKNRKMFLFKKLCGWETKIDIVLILSFFWFCCLIKFLPQRAYATPRLNRHKKDLRSKKLLLHTDFEMNIFFST